VARKAIFVAAVVVLIVLMAGVRVVISGHAARRTADRLLAEGNEDTAVGFYDRTLHMYWPGSPDVEAAVSHLSAMAGRRETAGDQEGALHIWRVLRSGLYAARGLYQPYKETIRHAEERIAALVALQKGDPTEQARHLEILQRSHDPRRSWSMLALLGFAVWLGGAVGFIWRGLSPKGKLHARPAAVWAAVFAGGYVLWLVGLYLA